MRQGVEQKSWLEPFRWKAVWPLCRTLEQPEQRISMAVGWRGGSCGGAGAGPTAGTKRGAGATRGGASIEA